MRSRSQTAVALYNRADQRVFGETNSFFTPIPTFHNKRIWRTKYYCIGPQEVAWTRWNRTFRRDFNPSFNDHRIRTLLSSRRGAYKSVTILTSSIVQIWLQRRMHVFSNVCFVFDTVLFRVICPVVFQRAPLCTHQNIMLLSPPYCYCTVLCAKPTTTAAAGVNN